MGKKKGKSKAQDESSTDAARDAVLVSPEEKLRDGEESASVPTHKPAGGGGKKGKKDRKKKALEEDWDDDLAEIATETGLSVDMRGGEGEGTMTTNAPSGGEGEGTMTTNAPSGGEGEGTMTTNATSGGEGGVSQDQEKEEDKEKEVADDDSKQTEAVKQEMVTKPAPAAESAANGSGKTGGKKKRKKKEQADWEDDVEMLAREIEGVSVSGTASGQVKMSTSHTSNSPTLELPEDRSAGVQEAVNEPGEGMGEEKTVKTKAEKKAAKKERDRKKKDASKQKGKSTETVHEVQAMTTQNYDQPPTTIVNHDQPQTTTENHDQPPTTTESRKEPTTEGGPATEERAQAMEEEEAEGEGEGDEKKKKKKKKKKTAEEEKKGKTKKPAKSAILKMKEQIEFMRAEQKRREEEERARQLAEEEARRREEEAERLEQERKEKRKQKEKERRERRKKEGKPVTKAEKEKYAKAQAMLQVMKDQGLQIPTRVPERGEGSGGRGKVRYATGRQKNKKTQVAEEGQPQTDEVASGPDDEMIVTTEGGETEEGGTQQQEQQEEVKVSWEDIADEEENVHVKDSWDAEDDEVEEVKKPVKPVRPVGGKATPTRTSSQGGEGDDEEEEEEEGSSEEESSESESEEELTPYEKAERRIIARRQRHKEEMSLDYLRSPVVCVLGHVDTGKTKILDKIRHTNVQDGEAGGITQQIGATFVPEDAIRTQTKMVKEFAKTEMKLPGLLIIDTPGHESFSNLRSRGSSMCDLAILVVDIMHGLEPQTLESLEMLRKGKTPFVVALNKIDRLFDWRRMPTSSVREAVKKQKVNTKDEFEERVRGVVTEFAEQGLNMALFWEKVDFTEYVPLVPTSAHTGDGMGDLISLLVSYSQKVLAPQLMLSQELEAIVLEVKVIAGLGTTIDVILRNGVLREGDTLVLTGTEGPFTTQVRALLMPQPLRELRVKNAYVNHKAIIASQGIKITAKDLEKTLAGTPIFVAKKADEIEVLKDEASKVVSSMLSAIQLQERGVYVQASTLGSLEALLAFLKQSKIPYCGVNIGPVHKRDVMKASVMLEHDSQWAVILAFDVRVERDAQEMADNLGVKVFIADIIYHLFDNFLQHRKELRDQKRREYESIAIFPCKLRILPSCVFNTRDPIVVGVVVEAGLVKRGTILTIPSKDFIDIGVVSSLEVNHKPVDVVHKGEEVCIKIEATGGDAPKLYGRHFDHTDLLVSKVSRESIDAVKNYFREDLQKSDWQLFIELKKLFHII